MDSGGWLETESSVGQLSSSPPWIAMASGNVVLKQIVLHHVDKMRSDTGKEVTGATYKAKFLGMLVQLARPSQDARLLALRYARQRTAELGRRIMRFLRELDLLCPVLRDQYLSARDRFGNTNRTIRYPEFGEGTQEPDLLQVQAANLSHSRRG